MILFYVGGIIISPSHFPIFVHIYIYIFPKGWASLAATVVFDVKLYDFTNVPS